MAGTWSRQKRRSTRGDVEAGDDFVYTDCRRGPRRHQPATPADGRIVLENELYEGFCLTRENEIYEGGSARCDDENLYEVPNRQRHVYENTPYEEDDSEENVYEVCAGDEVYAIGVYGGANGARQQPPGGGRVCPPRGIAPPPKPAPQATRPATRASAGGAVPKRPGADGAGKQRASPGVNAIKSGKRLAFSSTPKTPKAPWHGSTHLYNKNIFCAAVSRVAAAHASDAASSIWDLDPPRSNEDLERFLKAAVIRIIVCEGSKLLEVANAALAETREGSAAVGGGTYDRRHRSSSRRRSSRCARPPAGDFFDDSSD
ncbi:tegument protein VP22 [Equid alphaherpesvirus 3]|uniref:Tegument protein VP22 n=1 Tax=Equid alphaherpesvirus 3 TaxID=80341 RepID=A0A077BCI5_9ALPH|nr:tegument protein VP22 [Equid alphaherpesvirus 3]AIL02928.1 tegument protein VP22 [Equid alphaherpesvirus 3]